MALKHFKTPEFIHSNRIHRLDMTESHFRFGYDEPRNKRRKLLNSQPSRNHAFVSDLSEGQAVITHQFGKAIIKSIDDKTGHQVIEVLVKGTAGYRRETIYPLHIKSLC